MRNTPEITKLKRVLERRENTSSNQQKSSYLSDSWLSPGKRVFLLMLLVFGLPYYLNMKYNTPKPV